MKGFELIAALTSKWREAGRDSAMTDIIFIVQVGKELVPYTPTDIKVPLGRPTEIRLRRLVK
jgi:hypothetical protein